MYSSRNTVISRFRKSWCPEDFWVEVKSANGFDDVLMRGGTPPERAKRASAERKTIPLRISNPATGLSNINMRLSTAAILNHAVAPIISIVGDPYLPLNQHAIGVSISNLIKSFTPERPPGEQRGRDYNRFAVRSKYEMRIKWAVQDENAPKLLRAIENFGDPTLHESYGGQQPNSNDVACQLACQTIIDVIKRSQMIPWRSIAAALGFQTIPQIEEENVRRFFQEHVALNPQLDDAARTFLDHHIVGNRGPWVLPKKDLGEVNITVDQNGAISIKWESGNAFLYSRT